jgi:hypothetical protein
MKFIQFSDLPVEIQSLFRGHQKRFTFWITRKGEDYRYHARDDKGTDIFALRNGRWTCIANR